jgi:hypothetical protein
MKSGQMPNLLGSASIPVFESLIYFNYFPLYIQNGLNRAPGSQLSVGRWAVLNIVPGYRGVAVALIHLLI